MGILYPVTSGEGAYIQTVTSFGNLGVSVGDITNVPF